MHRALVVGLGAVGSDYAPADPAAAPLSHAGAYAAHTGIELVAGVDPDPAARERFAARWGAPAYAGIDEALAVTGPVELASLATPAGARLGEARKLLASGVRVLWCEKPLAADVATGEALVAAAREARSALLVGFLRRFDPVHRRVAARIHGGERLLHADVRHSGTLDSFGSHAVDLIAWLGGPIVAVEAIALEGGGALAALRTRDGATATVAPVVGAPTGLFEAELFTTGGRTSLQSFGERVLRAPIAPSLTFAGHDGLGAPVLEAEDGLASAMMGAVQAAIDHLDAGAPLPCDGADGLAALRAVEAIGRARTEHRTVALEIAP
ncbi:MAG TPA: Gfo/Idh/MocA family oxidoreductase [Capillimicrobium sp.]